MHIDVRYMDGIPEKPLRDFLASVARPGLELRVTRQEPSLRASIEWLAPTAVVVYLAKSYFDSFLGEMGKEHYLALKRGIEALGKRLLGRSGPKVRIISGSGRESTGDRFSIVYSVVAEAGEHRSIKLLLPKAVSGQELSDAVEAFASLLLDDDRLQNSIQESDRSTPAFDPVLVWFNPETALIEVVSPGPDRHERKA